MPGGKAADEINGGRGSIGLIRQGAEEAIRVPGIEARKLKKRKAFRHREAAGEQNIAAIGDQLAEGRKLLKIRLEESEDE